MCFVSWIIRFLPTVKQHATATAAGTFRLPALVYNSIFGSTASATLDIFIFSMLGLAFKAMAFESAQHIGSAQWTAYLLWTMQLLYYISLALTVTAVDNAFKQIRTICTVAMFFSLYMLVDTIILHLYCASSTTSPVTEHAHAHSNRLDCPALSKFLRPRQMSLRRQLSIRSSTCCELVRCLPPTAELPIYDEDDTAVTTP